MIFQIITVFACLAVASASPSGLGLLGPGAILTAPTAGGILTAPGILGAPALALGGAGVVTRGGGVVGVGPAGATVAGPPTAPATIIGPSGTVSAKGLWGPTLAGVVG